MSNTTLRRVRWTLRSLRKSPVFTTTAVLTVGLGIGATTLVFAVVYGVVLKPLPYKEPERIVTVWNNLVEERQFLPAVHAGDFRDYQRMSETFEEFAAASGSGVLRLVGIVTGDGLPVKPELLAVTHNFLTLLGVEPILGRHFTEEEEEFNGPHVAILSYELWATRYGSDREILGRSILLDGQAFTVVGVLPRHFRLLLPAEVLSVKHADIWVPLQRDYSRLQPRNYTGYTVLGRLKQHVTLTQAQADMDRIAEELRAIHPAHATSGMQIHLVPLHIDVVKNARPALFFLSTAVGLVLLISCANVANLFLLRGTARQAEYAVRYALGASRTIIMKQVFMESAVIASLGAALGLPVAFLGLKILVVLQPPNLPRLIELNVSGPVLFFAVACAAFTALIFGFVPAYRAARSDVSSLIREGTRTGRSTITNKLLRGLMIAEITLSVVLLIGSGLILRSYQALSDVRPGFDPEGALTFRISLPANEYSARYDVQDCFQQVQARLQEIPGVGAVGAISQLPLTGTKGPWPYAYDEETTRNYNLTADSKIVTPGYFGATGTQIIAGRDFDVLDNTQNEPVVIVDEMLAKRAWPYGDPIGRQMEIGPLRTRVTVIGVVEHVRAYSVSEDVREHLYLAHGQRPSRSMSMVVRSAGDPMSITAAVRERVQAVDMSLPVYEMRWLSAYVSDDMAETRLTLIVMTAFGILALLLSAVGVYGVVSYRVDQRSREFGIRLALGANPRKLVRSVVTAGLLPIGFSLGAGVFVAAILAHSMSALLFGVNALDPCTYVAATTVLLCVATTACYVPARRTATADAAATLKTE